MIFAFFVVIIRMGERKFFLNVRLFFLKNRKLFHVLEVSKVAVSNIEQLLHTHQMFKYFSTHDI